MYGTYMDKIQDKRAWLCLSLQKAELGAERFCALSFLESAVLGEGWG